MVTLQDIEETANKVYTQKSPTTGWPDCYDISEDIKDALITEHDINMEYLSLRECFPTAGYRHYVLEVSSMVTGESIVIDASFEQFDETTDTPVNAGRNVDPVVVVSPAASYLYFN